MRCSCCNVVLTPYESTLRNSTTNEFTDVCLKCHGFMENDVNVVGRLDLIEEVGTDIAVSIDYIDYKDTEYNDY